MKGLLGQKDWVYIYNESNLLRQNGNGGIDGRGVYYDGFLYEEYLTGELTEGVTFGFCYNSFPFICRYVRMTNTNFFNVHHSWQRDRDKYNRECPVCGRGVAAYLMLHGKYDERYLSGECHGMRYFGYNGKEFGRQAIFEAYLNLCRQVYKAIHYDEYQHYEATDNKQGLLRLEADFLHSHRENEQGFRKDCKETDREFFVSQLDVEITAYLQYVSEVEAGEHQDNKWTIAPDILSEVFGGDRAKAVAYLGSVIGKAKSISEYGRLTKKLLPKQQSHGNLVWLLICANDKRMKPKSVKTFTKEW